MPPSLRPLTYHYQPIVDMVAGHLSHHEALLRLLPLHNLPPRFLEMMDVCRLAELDRLALQAACTRLAQDPVLVLAVNMSPSSIARPDFCAETLRQVAGLARPEQLHIEITESHPIVNRPFLHAFLADLRALGCPVALDDVGAGHNLDLSLLSLPLTAIKIDGSHIQKMAAGDRQSLAFVTACVGMAEERGLTVTGEFIETPQQRDIALRVGIRHGQGYLFGRATRQPEPWPRDKTKVAILLPGTHHPLPCSDVLHSGA